jgi:hypothetical protein
MRGLDDIERAILLEIVQSPSSCGEDCASDDDYIDDDPDKSEALDRLRDRGLVSDMECRAGETHLVLTASAHTAIFADRHGRMVDMLTS